MGTAKTKKRTGLVIFLVVLGAVILLFGLAWAGFTLLLPRLAPAPAAAPEPTATPAPTAAPTPTPAPKPGYLVCPDGLFHPETAMTGGEVSEALALASELTVTAAEPEEALTEETLEQLLQQAFPTSAVMAAMDAVTFRGDETITRAEAAVVLNRLLGIPGGDDAYFPDVAPGYWAWADVCAAGRSDRVWTGPDGLAESGLLLTDGRLYYVDENGYCLKNTFVNTLFFGPDGKYTSGSRELDAYVEEIIRSVTDESMTREEDLRAVYDHVRDNYTYLKRNYYDMGAIGWQLNEALTMFSTGRGNCYCYASAFWALARGVGYDAKTVSGTCGNMAPHGWVEIMRDGVRYTYDVELEMVQRHKENRPDADFYAMTNAVRAKQNYVEQGMSDDVASRQTNDGLRGK